MFRFTRLNPFDTVVTD